MKAKKYLFIGFNIFIILAATGPIIDLYKVNQSIKGLILPAAVFVIGFNLVLFIIYWIAEGASRWLNKRNEAKYNLYEWLGNPANPITLENKLSQIKNFTPENFKENCTSIKKEILMEISEKDELISYKKFLELKNISPRFSTLLSSSQNLFIAILTASILTFLNFTDNSYPKLIISYIFLIFSGVALAVAIDYMSKAIDRDKLLLILVNECIEEKENEILNNENL